MRYKIVHSHVISNMQNLVNDALNEGYELVGGLSVDDDGYYQAVIRPAPSDKAPIHPVDTDTLPL